LEKNILPKKEGFSGKNSRLGFDQGKIHEDYFYFVYETFILAGVPCGKIVIRERKPDKRTGNIYYGLSFRTKADPYFTTLRNIFYPNNKKIIPNCIGNYLTLKDIAFWLKDDAHFTGSRLVINTHSFTKEEVELLIYSLNNNYNFNTYIGIINSNNKTN
jgi:hypothetical protein